MLQGWYGKYGVLTPFLFGPSQTAVSLGDKTDQSLLRDRQTGSLTERRVDGSLSNRPAFAISDIKNLTAPACANNRQR